jgi:hypothetical protein
VDLTVTGRRCEACDSVTSTWTLRGGGQLERCRSCGHLRRDLAETPQTARQAQYSTSPGGGLRHLLTERRLLGRFAASRAHPDWVV